jgi:hypothetical protein
MQSARFLLVILEITKRRQRTEFMCGGTAFQTLSVRKQSA